MMPSNLEPYEDLVEQGYLRRVVDGDLVLYNYTDKCTYDAHWNYYTRRGRGIVFDMGTGGLVSLCLPKFFGLNENHENMLYNLPRLPFVVEDKVDGSCVFLWHHNGQWRTRTRGSFDSDQAIKAREILSDWFLDDFPTNLTYCFEILYAANKIVVNYGDREELS